MALDDTLVTARHFEYIAKRTTGEDTFLASLRAAAKKEGIPPISIGPAQGSFLQIVLKLARAKTVVEVGTLAGYSAIWMARALPPGGVLHTIEYLEKHADFARRWAAKSDVADRIIVHQGDGRSVMKTFPDGFADATFLDADKKSYPIYLKESLRLLRPGGLVMVDNAFAFGQLFDKKPTDDEAPAVQKFNEVMARTKEVHGIIVPLGDGCWVGVKR